ncbi:MAG: hypothetical protein IKF99_00405 [Oscillospiraceae bacterium]|nr:hypothetical protein [Oscillospiraceae bacterium]
MSWDITWAGVALSTLGCNAIVEEAPETNRPRKKVDRYEVPGRNGDIIISQGAFENVQRRYNLEVHDDLTDYDTAAAELMAWLYVPEGYQRLTDTFDTAVYRKAFVYEDTDIENMVNTDGRCTVQFECDPRRFLLTGETVTTLTGSGTITNPTSFTSRPSIEVHGSGNGTITAGGNTITITGIVDGMVLDCDSQNAYKGTSNYNSLITGVFPVIPGGSQTITITGGITSIKVTPNWWTI